MDATRGETGLFGPLALAASDPLPAELRQFRHCFQAALNGVKTDWRHWLGKGPGLTPSHDDTLSGMLLAARYYGALDARPVVRFACSDNLQLVTTAVSVSYYVMPRKDISPRHSCTLFML